MSASDDLRAALQSDTTSQYEALPESIKATMTRKEYLWLTDAQKADLIRVETEPEWEEPGGER
jgi:hypothetical protein